MHHARLHGRHSEKLIVECCSLTVWLQSNMFTWRPPFCKTRKNAAHNQPVLSWVIWLSQRTKLTNWLGKRFVHFDKRVRTGESRTRITEQSKATIWTYKTWTFFNQAIVSLDKTLIHRLKPFKQFAVCTESVFWTLTVWLPVKCIIGRKILECFHPKP